MLNVPQGLCWSSSTFWLSLVVETSQGTLLLQSNYEHCCCIADWRICEVYFLNVVQKSSLKSFCLFIRPVSFESAWPLLNCNVSETRACVCWRRDRGEQPKMSVTLYQKSEPWRASVSRNQSALSLTSLQTWSWRASRSNMDASAAPVTKYRLLTVRCRYAHSQLVYVWTGHQTCNLINSFLYNTWSFWKCTIISPSKI